MNAVELAIATVLPDIFEPESRATNTPRRHDIAEGQRNATLASMAGAMRRKHFSIDAIVAALTVTNAQRCHPPLHEGEVEQIARSIGRYPGGDATEPAALRGLTLPELEQHVFDHRRPLLYRGETVILREGYLAEIYAMRGIGKTWAVQTLAYVAATAGAALGFRAEEPARVLHIDGEMAGPELQERYGIIRDTVGGCAPANLVVVAADWQDEFLPRLDTEAGREAVEPFVENADLVVLDNRSTLFDPEAEKDPGAWQPAQDWLLALRRRRKAVILVHHSNRQGGARGHSKPEDVMNVLIKLSRPDGYTADQGARFVLEFEKTRGVHGAALAPFAASLKPDGWHVEGVTAESDHVARKLREYLHLAHRAGDRPTSASRAITQAQVNRNAGFAAWARLKDSGALQEHPDGGWFLG